MSPPPPTGTNTAERSRGLWRRIFVPDGALPGDDQRIVEGMNERGAALRAAARRISARPPRSCPRAARTSAPSSRTASTLISGVVCGITMTARMPSRWAENATPCAWLPALAVMTPRARSASVRWAMRLYAPRSLKLKTGCRSSRLKRTVRAQASRESWRHIERRLAADVVHAAREDQPQHLFDGGRGETGRIGDGHVVAGAERRFGPARMQQITKFPATVEVACQLIRCQIRQMVGRERCGRALTS